MAATRCRWLGKRKARLYHVLPPHLAPGWWDYASSLGKIWRQPGKTNFCSHSSSFGHQPKMDEPGDSRSWIYLWYTPFRFVLSTFLLDLFQRTSAQAGWPRVKWRIKGFLCRLSRTIVWPAPSSLNPPLKSLPPTHLAKTATIRGQISLLAPLLTFWTLKIFWKRKCHLAFL